MISTAIDKPHPGHNPTLYREDLLRLFLKLWIQEYAQYIFALHQAKHLIFYQSHQSGFTKLI